MAFEQTTHVRGLNQIIELLSPESANYLKRDLMEIMIDEATLAIYDARDLLYAQVIPYPEGWSLGRTWTMMLITRIDLENMEVELEVRTPWAAYLEFGTRYMHARPFWRMPMWNHFFNLRPRMEQRIQEWWSGKGHGVSR